MNRRLLVLTVAFLLVSATSVMAMDSCVGSHRVTCVVDGDTVWIEREKIRLEGIDTPELRGECLFERDLAARAAERLRQLLSGGGWRIERSGNDRYGRTLARFHRGGETAGAILIREGLARPWRGRREDWCNGRN